MFDMIDILKVMFMIYYYFYTLFISIVYFINKKVGCYFILLGVPIFLIFLPTTGWDYDFYKESYDNAVLISTFPYFESVSSLTAEPLYVWYSSAISVLTKVEFSIFLALNFLISCAIVLYGLNIGGINSNIKYYYFLFFMPVIIPTIFYFSPRSSISFCFVFLGFMSLFFRKRLFCGLYFLFIGFSFHTQYFLISLYLFFIYLLALKFDSYKKSSIIVVNLIVALFLFLFLFFLSYFEKIIATVFSFLPSASVAVSKLHYVSDSEGVSGGFRLTSIFSIIIYPMCLYFFIKKIDSDSTVFSKITIFGVVGIVFFGVVVNLVFMGEPHVAGRLSRFSDYFCMSLLIPYTFYLHRQYLMLKLLALVICALTPILFKSLYLEPFEIF